VDNYPGDIECFNQKFTTFNKFAVFSVNRTDDLLNNAPLSHSFCIEAKSLSGPKDGLFSDTLSTFSASLSTSIKIFASCIEKPTSNIMSRTRWFTC
jgi:hypothetical protein